MATLTRLNKKSPTSIISFIMIALGVTQIRK